MEVRSIHRGARISAFKCREVTREIQGLSASKAVDVLAFTAKKGARLVLSTLKSAIANAENNNNLRADKLVVKEAVVGEGPTLKVETRMRRVTDKEIEQCLDACGDLQNYRDGKITRSKAIAWTAAWLRQQWDEREL